MKHIVITGSHGVGKSTLAQNLVSTLQSKQTVALVRETARQLVERGFEVNDKMNEEGFVSYITLYLQSFRASNADLVISDRSLFDLYLYTHGVEGRIRPLYIEMLHELVFAEAAQVDVYAYVPIEFEMSVDEVRPADLAYQSAIDAEVVRLLQHFNLKTITLRGSLSERTEMLIEHLYG